MKAGILTLYYENRNPGGQLQARALVRYRYRADPVMMVLAAIGGLVVGLVIGLLI